MQPLSFYNNLSISKKLSLWYGLSLLVMLSLFGYILYKTFHQSIHHNYDRHLRFEAEQITPFIKFQNDSLSINLEGYSRSEALKGGIEYGTFVRFYDNNGNLIYQSPNFSETPEPLETNIRNVNTEYSFSRIWQSLPSRTLYYPIKYENSQEASILGWLEITGFEWTLHEETTRFRKYLLILILLSVGFSILSGYGLSRRALSPVTSIIAAAKSITATDLDKRIPVNYLVRDELTYLAETFNIMLNRLQLGFEREKRFTSDASHELMTPLSSLLSEAEIMLRKPRTNEEYRETLERMLEEVKRMSELLHLLLQLSRVESVHRSQPEVINVSRLTNLVAERYNSAAQQNNIDLKASVAPELYIRAHGTYIEEVLNNLLENSLKYTPEGGSIYLELKRSSGKMVLHLSDSGIGFDKDTRDHLFERFYRATQREVQNQPGSGLGLPLVKAIVNLYGGKIRPYSDGPGQGSTFVVELPLVDAH